MTIYLPRLWMRMHEPSFGVTHLITMLQVNIQFVTSYYNIATRRIKEMLKKIQKMKNQGELETETWSKQTQSLIYLRTLQIHEPINLF